MTEVADLLRESMALHLSALPRKHQQPRPSDAPQKWAKAAGLRSLARAMDPEKQDPAWADEQARTPMGADTDRALSEFYSSKGVVETFEPRYFEAQKPLEATFQPPTKIAQFQEQFDDAPPEDPPVVEEPQTQAPVEFAQERSIEAPAGIPAPKKQRQPGGRPRKAPAPKPTEPADPVQEPPTPEEPLPPIEAAYARTRGASMKARGWVNVSLHNLEPTTRKQKRNKTVRSK